MSAKPRRLLTLFDATNIMVGIIVGVGIYESTPLIAQNVPNISWLMGVWIFGGGLSLVGALCYAELATAYPYQGGDYVYLNRAFGRSVGFLYAWSKLSIVRPGSIAAMAFIFGRYANELYPLGVTPYAIGSILLLSGINILGVKEGKWTQNLLTMIKVVGLIALVWIGFLVSSETGAGNIPEPHEGGSIKLALIFVLFAFGGWNEVAYVAAEIRNPQKNIVRSLILGVTSVTLIYVLINAAFVHSLGFEGLRNSSAAASDVVQTLFFSQGKHLMSLLIGVSALGAINGMIFTGSRISYAMGTEHKIFSLLGRWNERLGTPAWALAVEAAITISLLGAFSQNESGFESMVLYTTPVFWLFLFLVSLTVFKLRKKSGPGHFRTPLYPVVPFVFSATSLFMLVSSLLYAWENLSVEVLWSLAVFLFGAGVLWFERKHAH